MNAHAKMVEILRRAGAPPRRAKWMAKQLRQQGCILCGTRALSGLGAFIPTDPADWPGPPPRPGKMRVWFYLLCAPCAVLNAAAGGRLVEDAFRKVPRA